MTALWWFDCPCLLQFLTRNNFYVLIDDHSEDPTVQNDPNLWVQYWVQLMTDITADPVSRNRVMVDPLNEPDHAGYNWGNVGSDVLLNILCERLSREATIISTIIKKIFQIFIPV